MTNVESSRYNWNLMNGVAFLVFGILSVWLHFSDFADSAPIFKWIFFLLGGLMIALSVYYFTRGKRSA